MKKKCEVCETFSVRLFDTPEVVQGFWQFLIREEIIPITNSFSGGPDCFFGSFPIENKEAITEYLKLAGCLK